MDELANVMGAGPWVVVALVVLVLFGVGRLPSLLRSIGLGMRQLRRELREEEENVRPSGPTKTSEPTKN